MTTCGTGVHVLGQKHVSDVMCPGTPVFVSRHVSTQTLHEVLLSVSNMSQLDDGNARIIIFHSLAQHELYIYSYYIHTIY